MARAAYGPGNDEWTLVLEPGGDCVYLITLLNESISKIEAIEKRGSPMMNGSGRTL